MTDLVIVGAMLAAVGAYVGATWVEVRTEARRQARLKSEEQAQRDRAIDIMRRAEIGVNWAMQRTPSDWVR